MSHKCSYSHKLSQNLLEKYLLNNLAAEFDKFRARTVAVSDTKKPQVKKRSRSAINAEINRLNLLFQKGRIEFDYYNDEYTRLEQEIQDLDATNLPKADYSHIEKLLEDDFLYNYNSLSDINKQSFWHEIIERIYLDGADVTAVDFRHNVSD